MGNILALLQRILKTRIEGEVRGSPARNPVAQLVVNNWETIWLCLDRRICGVWGISPYDIHREAGNLSLSIAII